MAYHQPSNPDALPRFAEPEREQDRRDKVPHSSSYRAQPPRPLDRPIPPRAYASDQYSPGHPPSGARASPRPAQPSPRVTQPSASHRMSSSPGRDGDFNDSLIPLFQAVDRDRRGQLTERELGAALVNGDFSPFDEETVRMMIRMFDSDRSGTIGFKEFCGLWAFLSEWRRLFDRFDKDNSGNISLSEFREALLAFRYRLSDRFVEVVFRQYDKKRTGALSFDLFVQASITLKRMTDAFKKYDDDRDGFITLGFEDFLEEILRQMR